MVRSWSVHAMSARGGLFVAASMALAVSLLFPACSFVLVRPRRTHERPPEDKAPTSCFTNSYVWPTADVALTGFFLVAPPLELKRVEDRCAAGDEQYCSSTNSVVIAYMLLAPVFAWSAVAGYRGVAECRRAGSTPRWMVNPLGW